MQKLLELIYTAGRNTQTTFEAFESGFLVRFIITNKTLVLKKLIISVFQKQTILLSVPKSMQDVGPAAGWALSSKPSFTVGHLENTLNGDRCTCYPDAEIHMTSHS